VKNGGQTTATQRALLCLYNSGYNGASSGEVGGAVWPQRELRGGRGVSSNGGGDYAAQMLLGRLKKAGLVEYAASEGSSRWRLSTEGQKVVHKLTSAKEPKKATPCLRTGGAIVTASDPCTCGCAPEDHGRDPEYPGSTSCTACEDCIAYEADPEAA
jgi:hypothetical protein